MTRIDFYLLTADAAAKPLLACRLANKAFRLGHQSYILTVDSGEAERLDKLLWTFSPDSFVPHGLYDGTAGSTAAPAYPVTIGCLEPPLACHDVLISLLPEVPDWFGRFARVVELVGNEEQDKARARERFRFYRERGYPLETHDIQS